jgi:hypothetical protein
MFCDTDYFATQTSTVRQQVRLPQWVAVEAAKALSG